MNRLFFVAIISFILCNSAFAEKPDFYDRSCLANQKSEYVKAPNGNYFSLHVPSPDECLTHGTYYVIKLHMGSISAGEVSTFREYALTQEAAHIRAEFLERKYHGYNNDVWATVEPVKY